MANPPASPAGWYDDTDDATVKRYWDGAAWTSHTAPHASAPSAGAPEAVGKKKPKWWLIGGAAVVGLIIISNVANAAAGGGDSSDKASSVVTGEPTAEPQPSVTPTPTATPVVVEPAPTAAPPVPAVDAAVFAQSARGDLLDFAKDLDDMDLALDEGGFFRLMTNSVELSFNLGQMQASTAPTSIATAWEAQLSALEGSIDTMDAEIAEERNDDLRATIALARAQVAGLQALTEKVG